MKTRSEARRERDEREERKEKPKKPEREFTIDVPNDPVNEQVILAAEMVDRDVRKRGTKLFPADAFYAEPHRLIQAGLIELERLGLEYDPATLARVAPDVDIRILETLNESRSEVPANIEFHIETLQWDWHRAQATKGPISSLLDAVQNPKETPDRVRALARLVGQSFEGVKSGARFLRDPKEVVHQMMATLRGRVEGTATYPFGIDGLDNWEEGTRDEHGDDISGTPRIRPGAAPGLTTILTGMSGAGKTTLAAHIILGLARQKRKVLVGAWEVRAPMTLELITTLSLKWSRSRILDGRSNQLRTKDDRFAKLTPEELIQFEERAHLFSPYIVFVDNPFRRGSVRGVGRITNDDYLDILEEHVEASGCSVALYDLFDRVLRERRPDQEQEAVWRMLEMAERLQIHQMLVHQQLLKGDDVRKDMRPSIQGLKGSSAYVDAGALILAPHLPARFKAVPDDTMEIFGLKQRYGPPFGVEMRWAPDTGQIWGGRSISIESRAEPTDEAFSAPKGKGRRR